MPFRVFVSYSWSNSSHQAALTEVLQRPDPADRPGTAMDVVVDRRIVGSGERDVHDRILDQLAACDVVIALLTKASVESCEVREELALAYEWHIPILLVRDKRVPADKVPWFLTDHHRAITFDSEDRDLDWNEKLAEIRKAAGRYRERYGESEGKETRGSVLRSIYREIRQLAKQVSRAERMQLFRLKVISQVLEATAAEVAELAREDYRQNLSLDNSFIVRAGPIFRSARRVYATSVDRLSRFWLSESQELAVNYTVNQPAGTRRVFAFSSPRSANDHRHVLQFHHECYGSTHGGGVFVCAWEQYEAWLKNTVGPQKYVQFHDKDFGILVFGEESSAEQEVYEATLSQAQLQLARKKPGEVGGYIGDLVRAFERLAADEPTEKSGIYKWKPQYSQSDSEWEKVLAAMFKARTPAGGSSSPFGDIYHMVFFSDDVDERKLTEAISGEIPKLMDLWRKDASGKLIKEVWFGTRRPSSAVHRLMVLDPKFNGLIRTNSIFNKLPYCLMMRFENKEALEEYYTDHKHAEAREKIFRACDDESKMIEKLYELLYTHKDNAQAQAAIYHAIEGAVGQHMFRADYSEHNDLGLIVSTRPPAYPSKARAQGDRRE